MILERLKRETADEHAAAEQAVEQLGYLRSTADYRGLLERLWGFYEPLERQIAACPGWGGQQIDLGRRMKAPLLARDLIALGHTPESLAALPRCQALPAPAGLAHTLGCMYVLEGATLGGQIISRQIRGALGLTPDGGGSFYTSYGPEVGAMWREFRALLVAVAADTAAEEQMLGGAHATFRAFQHWLSRE